MKLFLSKITFSFLLILILNSCSTNEDNKVLVPKENISTEYKYVANETELLDLINGYRVSKGLNVLVLENYLSKSSENHVLYMISKNEISHDLFLNRSNDIINTLGANKVAENVAYKFNSANSTLTAWLASPLHKQNLEGDFTHFGISIKTNSEGVKFYTNIFMKK